MVTLESIRKKVQEKRELRGLAVSVVDESIARYLGRRGINPEPLTTREVRLIVKEVRAELRRYTGRFQKKSAARTQWLEQHRYNKLLTTHASAAARQTDYPLLREELAKRGVKSILDIGCGLNPIALARPGMSYDAVDIREDELALIRLFFQQEHIEGRALALDVRKELPAPVPVDACLLMNILDVIEKRAHKRAEEILTAVNARFFFISFSTKTLSGRPMRHPQRGWIERLLDRKGFKWERHMLTTEVLYVAEPPKA